MRLYFVLMPSLYVCVMTRYSSHGAHIIICLKLCLLEIRKLLSPCSSSFHFLNWGTIVLLLSLIFVAVLKLIFRDGLKINCLHAVHTCRQGRISLDKYAGVVSVYKLSVKHESFASLLDLCKVELNICSISVDDIFTSSMFSFILSNTYVRHAYTRPTESRGAT